jgi:hypothetical protein
VAKRARETTSITLQPRDTLLLLSAFFVANFQFADAWRLLEASRFPPACTCLPQTERYRLLEQAFQDTDQGTFLAVVDIRSREHVPRLYNLWLLLAEKKAADWVLDANWNRGVAPSSRQLLQKFKDFREDSPPEVLARCPQHATVNARTLWARRWRRRWHAVIGTLKIGDVDPPDVLRTKAGSSSGKDVSTEGVCHEIWGCRNEENCARLWADFRAHVLGPLVEATASVFYGRGSTWP